LKKIKYLDIVKKLKTHSIDLISDIDNDEIFESINSVSSATSKDLSFFSNIKYIDDLKKCKAKACIIKKEYSKYLSSKCKYIIVNDPYLSLAYLSELFSDNDYRSNGVISTNTNLSKNCKLSKNVQIDPFCNIEANTEIASNVIIGSNTTIGPNVKILNNSIIQNNVSISNAIINENCLIKSGARIGSDGFGFEEKSKKKIIHHGNVIIKKNCTIGSNTTIDRAVFESTTIGEFSQIDNLVQIAHNVVIGKHAIIAAQVGIAGSTKIGDFVKIGGQAGISGHLIIGDNVTIAAKSGVTKSISNNMVIAGFPAKDIKLWKKEIIRNSSRK